MKEDTTWAQSKFSATKDQLTQLEGSVEAQSKVVKEFKASNKFGAEVVECSSASYGYNFDTYRVQVAYFFIEVDFE